MNQVKDGDKVKVHYTGTLKDGSVFDSSEGKEPLSFEVGQKMMIPDFEECVKGMEPGEKKKISITAENAYGEYRQDLIVPMAKSKIPADIKLEIGATLQADLGADAPVNLIVKEIQEDTVVFDANHQLAGKDLIFDIELIEIG